MSESVRKRDWQVACWHVFHRHTHTHKQGRCSSGHFLTKEGIQKFLYLDVAAHSPVDPFLSQPYQKEREESKRKESEKETERMIYGLRKWENLAWGRRNGGVSCSGKVQLYRKTKEQRWTWPTLSSRSAAISRTITPEPRVASDYRSQTYTTLFLTTGPLLNFWGEIWVTANSETAEHIHQPFKHDCLRSLLSQRYGLCTLISENKLALHFNDFTVLLQRANCFGDQNFWATILQKK